jgi:2-methylcitrate dehydratase PrpD
MDSHAPSITQTLAGWVVRSDWASIDVHARRAAASSWLNWFGCALGGASDPAVEQLVRAARQLGGNGVSPLLGRPETADPATAALVHAFASNILDFDDTHWATAIHPAGTVASALVAWAGQEKVSGADLLHAFLLGMEVECRVGLAVTPGHYERGWHITATCGVFGAAVAVGRLMGLSRQQMAWAIGHAATQSGGLVASLGTMAKSLNIANASRNGLLAAQWARHGITANEHAIEAKFGFMDVMGSGPVSSAQLQGLGQEWECARNTFKPYPCGFLLHPALDACLSAHAAVGEQLGRVEPAGIERISIAVHPLAVVRADRAHPADGIESKLSLQHAAAMAVMRGEAGVRAFTDTAVMDPEVRACRDKVRIASDEALAAGDACVEVRLANGASITRAVHSDPALQPAAMSESSLKRKFRDLVAYGAAHCDAHRLLDALENLPDAPDVRDVFRMTLRAP